MDDVLRHLYGGVSVGTDHDDGELHPGGSIRRVGQSLGQGTQVQRTRAEVVLGILRSETLDARSRELGLPSARLSERGDGAIAPCRPAFRPENRTTAMASATT